jgi:S1-C subfamily serine protease
MRRFAVVVFVLSCFVLLSVYTVIWSCHWHKPVVPVVVIRQPPLQTIQPPADFKAQRSPFFERLQNVTVKIACWEAHSVGTGILVGRIGNQALILTDRHVFKTGDGLSDTATVYTGYRWGSTYSQGSGVVAKVIAHSPPKRDLTLLKADFIPSIIAEFIPGEYPAMGTEIYKMGCPNGQDMTLARGIVTRYEVMNAFRYVRTDAAIYPGDSGSGMWTKEGFCIGIVQQIEPNENFPTLNRSLAACDIIDWLRKNAPEGQPGPTLVQDSNAVLDG